MADGRHGVTYTRIAARRLIQETIRPGDVVLTGRSTGLSSGIQAVLGASTSHALLVVSARHLVESNDHLWNMSERAGGVYVETVWHACMHRDVDHVVVRRPSAVDVDLLERWCLWKIQGGDTFASAGLVLLGLRHIGGAVRRLMPVRWRGLTPSVVSMIQAIADGATRLTCAEFVYRGLLASGAQVEVPEPYFDEEFRTVQAAVREVPPARPPGENFVAQLRHALATTDRPRARPGSGEVSGGPLQPLEWGMVSFRDLIRQYRTRREEPLRGDQADFVTPLDLLRSPSLETVLVLQRDRRYRWSRVRRFRHRRS